MCSIIQYFLNVDITCAMMRWEGNIAVKIRKALNFACLWFLIILGTDYKHFETILMLSSLLYSMVHTKILSRLIRFRTEFKCTKQDFCFHWYKISRIPVLMLQSRYRQVFSKFSYNKWVESRNEKKS